MLMRSCRTRRENEILRAREIFCEHTDHVNQFAAQTDVDAGCRFESKPSG
jgi:hypothetical protein